MYCNFRTCPQLYSAQAPISSVYEHIHFLFHGDWVRQHTVKGLCAARLKICYDTTVSKIDYVFHKGEIIILRKNQSIFIYQSKIAYPVPFLPLL